LEYRMIGQYAQRILFIFLLTACVVASAIGLMHVGPLLARLPLGFLLALAALSLLVVLLDTFSVPLRRRGDLFLGRLLSRLLGSVYSICVRCLRLVGLRPVHVHRVFVRLNNLALKSQAKKHPNSNITVLLPFCLQGRRCSITLASDASNCRSCGRCQIGELVQFSRQEGVGLRIASRSELAPSIVRECSSDLAIAIACSEKLAKGVIWTYYCPCFCIEALSNGQSCLEPSVSLPAVKEAIRFFGGGRAAPEASF
jgi:hypothetical protein